MEDPAPAESLARRFRELWRQGRRPDVGTFLAGAGALPPGELAEVLRVDQRERWLSGERVGVEIYLDAFPALAADEEAVLDVIFSEFLLRQELGESPEPGEYLERFPRHAPPLRLQFEVHRLLPSGSGAPPAGASFGLPATADDVTGAPSTRNTDPVAPHRVEEHGAARPERIGRYTIERVLGEGHFGVVYRARDEELRRTVAVKVPKRERISHETDVETYLAEARMVAGLDHPAIVPVYDVGRTADGLCYVVSKYIPGSNFAEHLSRGRPPLTETVTLLARVSEALHHAHRKGLVHRDVKPANMLLDGKGNVYLADFGLALRPEDFEKAARFAGTPAYMSPEQARGEADRLDGRSDVFGLGVVLYEALTGRRPFPGRTLPDILDGILHAEPVRPQYFDARIPPELSRTCLKSLQKRPDDRHQTAGKFASELRNWLAATADPAPAPVRKRVRPPHPGTPKPWLNAPPTRSRLGAGGGPQTLKAVGCVFWLGFLLLACLWGRIGSEAVGFGVLVTLGALVVWLVVLIATR